jgi:hypothetical protein
MGAFGSVVREWGSTAEERAEPFPCDKTIESPDGALYRAVSVAAPTDVVFLWLCQLRVAPYSYDLIDNLGRRSPRQAEPSLCELEVGQRVMEIFRLVSFEPGRSITLESGTKLLGRLAVTYRTTATGQAGSRLVAKITFVERNGILGAVLGRVLPTGDLLMMRKQLLTLKKLAERDA